MRLHCDHCGVLLPKGHFITSRWTKRHFCVEVTACEMRALKAKRRRKRLERTI